MHAACSWNAGGCTAARRPAAAQPPKQSPTARRAAGAAPGRRPTPAIEHVRLSVALCVRSGQRQRMWQLPDCAAHVHTHAQPNNCRCKCYRHVSLSSRSVCAQAHAAEATSRRSVRKRGTGNCPAPQRGAHAAGWVACLLLPPIFFRSGRAGLQAAAAGPQGSAAPCLEQFP